MNVRKFTRADKTRLYAFFAVIWPDRAPEVLDRRWWWLFDVPPLLIAEDDTGEITGVCACIPFELFVAPGNQRNGAWIVDFFVLTTHQGKGIGGLLVKAAGEYFGFLASLSQTDAALGAFRRMGWSPRTYMPLYLCPSARISFILSRLRISSKRVDVSVTPASFGNEFDELWERSRERYAPLSIRDSATLTRRFENSRRDYSVVAARIDGRLEGYFVLRTLRKGSIRSFGKRAVLLVADCLVAPDRADVFGALLRGSLAAARKGGVRHLACTAMVPEQRAILRRYGFIGPEYRVFGRAVQKLAVGFTASADAPPKRPWSLTPMDCDMDYILEAHP